MEKDIRSLLRDGYSKEEEDIISTGSIISRTAYQMMSVMLPKVRHKIWYKPKTDNKDQYGYYPNTNIGIVNVIMKRLSLTSVLDLGSGPGITMHTISHLSKYSYYVGGIENEEYFVKVGNEFLSSTAIRHKDILTLTSNDVSMYEVLYTWDPLVGLEMVTKFTDKLTEICTEKHVIIVKHHAVSVRMQFDMEDTFEFIGSYKGHGVFRKFPPT